MDLIDRQAAIKDAESWVGMNWYEQHLQRNVVEWLKEFPPALGTDLSSLVTDCISRQSAIDALRKLREEDIEDYGCEIPEGFNQNHLDRATFAIKQLPPIQPKRGKCKWCERLKERNLRIEYYWIDQEGCTASFSEPHVVATGIANFCPNCGAKMEVTT